MRLKLFPAALMAALAVTLPAQQPTPPKRPMTFADLQAMKRISDPQISPSGKWVLFSVTEVDLAKNAKANSLWIVPLDGSAPERRLAGAAGKFNGRFSPDGKALSFTHESQIWVAPFDDATGTLGDDHAVTALETEADGAIWAPDSKHFLFVSNVYPECESKAPLGPQRNDEEANCNALKDTIAAKSPVKALIFDHLLYRHWDQYQGPKHSHIFYGSTEAGAGAPTDLTPASVIGDHEAPTFSLGGPLGYAISPDGKEIAYVTNLDKVPAESTNNDIFVLDPTADPSRARRVSTSPGSDDGPQYSPDGKWLAWRSQARNGFESDKFDLVVMDRASTTEKPGPIIKNLTAALDGWVDEFSWLPNMSAIIFTSATQGEEPIYLLPFLPDAPTQVMRKRDDLGEFGDIHMLGNGVLVASRMGINHPTEIYATKPLVRQKNGNFAGGEAFMLTHLNDAVVATLSIDQAESFWFAGADNTKVEGFIVKPPNFDASKKYPVKFLMHGGPQTAWGDAWSYRWNPELFAANGYVVVMINRRGSTGYGQKFLEEVSGDWGGRAFTDLMKGLDYAEKTYPFLDKDRECALGASYGGFMANWVLTHTNRFKCIVTHDGMYNPQSAFGTTEELWFNEWEFRPLATTGTGAGLVEQQKPAHPWDYFDKPAAQDPFRKNSPMMFIKQAHTPTLVIHGQRDYRLDVSEGFQLFTALQLLGVPSRMLYFPDEGHWVLKPQDSQLWYETVNDWCDRWTGTNKYASVGPEKNPMAVPGPGPKAQGPGKTQAHAHPVDQ